MSNRVTTLAVVALVLLAGCAGGPLGGDSASPDDATNETDSPTTTTTADLEDVTQQSWVADDQSIAFERLVQRHSQVLGNASSYTFSRHVVSNTDSETRSRIAVDHERERANLSITSLRDDRAQYQKTFVANGTVYAMSESDPADVAGQDANMTGEKFDEFVAEQSSISALGGVPAAFQWEYVGVEDGAYVFEADDIGASERTSFDADNVTAASGRLVVSKRGVVDELSLSLTVEMSDGEQSASVTIETVGVDESEVAEPSWAESA
jgi:hypothetical protein